MFVDGNDSDDLIIQAFKAYDVEGLIDVKMFQHALKTWGDKMTKVYTNNAKYVKKSLEPVGPFGGAIYKDWISDM